MADQVEELIKEIAAKHGIAVSRDDPILILQTINNRLLQDGAKAQQAQLDQFKQEMEALSIRWENDAKGKAESGAHPERGAGGGQGGNVANHAGGSRVDGKVRSNGNKRSTGPRNGSHPGCPPNWHAQRGGVMHHVGGGGNRRVGDPLAPGRSPASPCRACAPTTARVGQYSVGLNTRNSMSSKFSENRPNIFGASSSALRLMHWSTRSVPSWKITEKNLQLILHEYLATCNRSDEISIVQCFW